jgi:hypothetical protein
MRKIISHRLIVMKGWLSGLQFLTAKFVNPAALSQIAVLGGGEEDVMGSAVPHLSG